MSAQVLSAGTCSFDAKAQRCHQQDPSQRCTNPDAATLKMSSKEPSLFSDVSRWETQNFASLHICIRIRMSAQVLSAGTCSFDAKAQRCHQQDPSQRCTDLAAATLKVETQNLASHRLVFCNVSQWETQNFASLHIITRNRHFHCVLRVSPCRGQGAKFYETRTARTANP